eukprot:3647810-Amphidinium_carterae.1
MGGKRRQEMLTPWSPAMARNVARRMKSSASPPPGLAAPAPSSPLGLTSGSAPISRNFVSDPCARPSGPPPPPPGLAAVVDRQGLTPT